MAGVVGVAGASGSRTALLPDPPEEWLGWGAEVAGMPQNYARDERAALCDRLAELGPDQPTLCAGWTTRDLAAHLLLRERRPAAAPGIVVRALSGYTERVRRGLAGRPYDQLVATLRRPPRWSPLALAPVDRAVNTLEMFLHHEDVRRGQAGWQPRALPAGLAAAL